MRTASSEQVRRPIFRDGVDHWRHYEPWLEPLEGLRAGHRVRGATRTGRRNLVSVDRRADQQYDNKLRGTPHASIAPIRTLRHAGRCNSRPRTGRHAARAAAAGGPGGTRAAGQRALEEIIVTAQKRAENLQDVPISIQALGTEQLERAAGQGLQGLREVPAERRLSRAAGPGFSLAYFRGVASGENNNHSGPQPSVGMYLDEQPITTIQGALDIHLYDIERVESLAGPQGTLYGASSQAGTIRIITNKPDPSAFDAAYALEGNTVTHGGTGYLAEGFVNLPLSDRAAVRLVGWTSTMPATSTTSPRERTYPTSGGCISNSKSPAAGCESTPARAEKDYNDVDTYGARAALRVDLNDNWTVTPQVMGQKQDSNGSFSYDPAVGDLKIARCFNEKTEDNWVQAALTVEGKIGNFDLVYCRRVPGPRRERRLRLLRLHVLLRRVLRLRRLLDRRDRRPARRSVAVHPRHGRVQALEPRVAHRLAAREPLPRHRRPVLHAGRARDLPELPDQWAGRLRRRHRRVFPISVTGWPDTIWLTNQVRKDNDQAVFGEMSFDILENLTATAGLRWFQTDNSLRGFFGFNANYSGNYGEALCFSDRQYNGSPCTNLDDNVDESGNVLKFNLTYRFDDSRLVYATYSEGYRPGGINRNGTVDPYKAGLPDELRARLEDHVGREPLRFNGAIFHEEWDDIQYSFLPPSGSGLTVIRNAGAARIDGIEADLTWAPTESLVVSGGFSWLDAQLTEDYVPDPDEPPAAFKGDSLPVAPEFKGNLTGRYTFQLGEYDVVRAARLRVQRQQLFGPAARGTRGVRQAAGLVDHGRVVRRGAGRPLAQTVREQRVQ